MQGMQKHYRETEGKETFFLIKHENEKRRSGISLTVILYNRLGYGTG